MMILWRMIRVCLSQYSVVWLWALAVILLGVSLVFLFQPSSSKADTIVNTIISETTTVESQGAGVELHTTTTVTEQKTIGDQSTTNNYLTNQGFQQGNTNGWTTGGQVQVCPTCGPFGGKALKTQGETGPGGSVSQTVDLFSKMTEAEIQHGFTLNYGSHVHSDTSNAQVPVCDSNPSNGPDCRDTFSITMTLKNSGGTVLHNFVHEFKDITFTGWNTTDFFFEQTIPENEYTSAFATLALFGIDSGFQSGFHGPRFDNALITATHHDVVIQQITSITEEIVLNAIEMIEETSTIDVTSDITETTTETVDNFETETVEVFQVSVADNMTNTETSFEVSIDTNNEMTIEPISVETPVETVETTVEEVTAEVESQVAEVTETEVENDVSNNVEPEQDSESSESSNEATAEEPKSKESASSSKAKSNEKPKSKEQVKKEIATRVVTKIIQKLGQDAASQATQLALMNVIGANININAPVLQDRTDFFTPTKLPDTQISDNNYAQYFMIGASNIAHDALIDSQYDILSN